jgi:glycerophosphoryl diester phosphodiesterase
MTRPRLILLALGIVLIGAVLAWRLSSGTRSALAQSGKAPALGAYFDCLRSNNQTLVSAHRAGPAPGLPENALETISATLNRNPAALLEIDVQKSADGTLFLLHDDQLDRTTTGSGAADRLSWKALAKLRLEDNDGRATRFRIPRLAEALALAKKRGAIVQLDVKRGVPFADVVAAVRKAKAERHALIITYNDRDAAQVAKLAPELMISVGITTPDMLARLKSAGIPAQQMLAWTGTRAPNPALMAELRAAGIEPMFGTLGRPGNRLDDQWLADGNASEFAELSRQGAVVIGTDRAAEIEPALPKITCTK